ncbi:MULTISPECIES: type VII toxin-antitoxin system MntA family adenylyltransferase antitoxin [unclassified Methanoculleus]|uniref:type VII toxin-antitoxin system MntA family adenylyltransferase antitoxin n=1 Tax=unclassified Methanoculleus TaxID=2619537 RepID=UPI0025FD7D0D|nr:nucleotidyltransferase family protein [Methanoculleus sp. UBA377]MDD2474160.1 nucleotidyltransferase family protein [Methanoculleus sp.]
MSVILTSIQMRSGEIAGRRLTRTARETIVAKFTQNDAEWIAIFGSYARGSAGPASDIDILVRFARKKSLFSLVRIEDELARSLRMKVDLVTENAVSPYLADAIYRDAVVIYDAGGPRVSSPHP